MSGIGGTATVFANAEVIKAAPTLPGAVDDIAFINESTVVSDDDARKMMEALQIQADRDFKPIWGQSTQLTYIQKGCKNPKNMAWLALMDDTDQAGALGYHDLTNEGLPLGKVFAKTDMQYGEEVSVTASHELLEMLADPYISYTMLTGQGATVIGYAWEVCDACEDSRFAYEINGIKVSDFVYPAWFQVWRKEGSTKFDHMSKITKPLQLIEGGYIGVWTPATGWQQMNAQNVPFHKLRPKVGQRRERRRTPIAEWATSQSEVE